jgi:hypothetical protein
MNTNLQNICATLDNLVCEVATFANDLRREANTHREDLISLYASMNKNRMLMAETASLIRYATDRLDEVADSLENTAELVLETIEGDDIPECDYEEFVDYCALCGRTITREDTYACDGEFFYCADCFPDNEE